MNLPTNSNLKTAVFINAKSIQNYVFNTNKLKHVVGASYIVKHAFDYFNQSGKEGKDQNGDFEVGYIGGGNAFLIFKNSSTAVKKIRAFTKNALINYPGLVFGIGQYEAENIGDLSGKAYKSLMINLVKDAAKKLDKNYPLTNVLKHGITKDCPYSGLSAEFYYELKKQYISRSVEAKISEKIWAEIVEADKSLLKAAGFNDQVIFASEFEDMGQAKGVDSHIAIVHIDGNGIGNRFRDCEKLKDAITLSDNTKSIIEQAFVEVLKEVKNLISPVKAGDKLILPLRPIILGGDDITFICNSKLGVWLAQRYMHYFTKIEIGEEAINFTACAGVCITKTKYPFYRGYKLAEELCQHAKEIYRNEGKQGNWLDFHLAQTDIPEELAQIRTKQYVDSNGKSLLKRPYVSKDLDQAIRNTIHLTDKLPEGWTKELRDVLYQGEDAWQLWTKKADWRKLDYKIFDNETITSKAHYYDLIELHEIIDSKLFTNPELNQYEDL